jgi:hypothetical protein
LPGRKRFLVCECLPATTAEKIETRTTLAYARMPLFSSSGPTTELASWIPLAGPALVCLLGLTRLPLMQERASTRPGAAIAAPAAVPRLPYTLPHLVRRQMLRGHSLITLLSSTPPDSRSKKKKKRRKKADGNGCTSTVHACSMQSAQSRQTQQRSTETPFGKRRMLLPAKLQRE